MELERRALYNLVRMNWLAHPQMQVEDWQVADYRSWSFDDLFSVLQQDEATFLAFAEECDTPEEFTEDALNDRTYLAAFELWRRLLPEKQTLSIFGDELDHCINAYDLEEGGDPEHLQDQLAYLQEILNENSDEGADPVEVGQRLGAYLANDLESFLYDYISDQIEESNRAYASELIEGFKPYMAEPNWFRLLEIRLMEDTEAADEALLALQKEADLDLLLEILRYTATVGDAPRFKELARHTVPLLEVESDLVELLRHTVDLYSYTDAVDLEQTVEKLLFARDRDPDAPVGPDDPALTQLNFLLE